MLRFLTAGESHGKALVTIVEGVPAGLTIDLDDPPDHPAKLITVRNQHPNLGHGVLQLLQLPPLENGSRAAEFAAQLNREEAARSLRTQWLGGWCVDAEGQGLTFASFIPALALAGHNAEGRRTVMTNLTLSQVGRAKFVSEVLAPARFADVDDHATS